MTPPVLLLIFNRPDHTEQVMEQIREAEPRRLYIGADGPRADHPDDARRCERAREVATRVDWDCEVHTLFRDDNLGTKEAVSSAITWFFEHVESGIILEDDCVPADSFFQFCSYLLDAYRSDDRVVMISGYNPVGAWRTKEQSYHFSNYGGIWGWATWEEEWTAYREAAQVKEPDYIERVLQNVLIEPSQVSQRKQAIEGVLSGRIESWAYQWFWARVLQSKLSVVPSKNLISNIGFGKNATRTSDLKDHRANIDVNEIHFPLADTDGVYPDREYDSKWFNLTHKNYSLPRRIIKFISRKRWISRSIKSCKSSVKFRTDNNEE